VAFVSPPPQWTPQQDARPTTSIGGRISTTLALGLVGHRTQKLGLVVATQRNP
jgi:hypothetical protein